ncbi:hypothetical protein CcaverHIS002_0111920 [Cutaneotrichosporon cavernicola]|uniref:2',3'-cyclic-nucleotide 3'-phosphodiesterase n=1 Tax=Cutaneotrichosporon cavernicola TaxID=279322 RepID=A0AA48L2C0_9TREE|nr:uncharacterized protein CcaverHIS019_0111810 [Cutaneotrichosporon cavernicola]BEI80663.1 hypothetical protein CcaverHIS002_0111920 [Cutaneotrichosporon cavernicola]BEI88463.1 hypothetical protein CcaverHIS019_0111810 [Cutaneotrichosporon cavernicola]BEI96236.1 hypothetical protein CcaverHIS631_0111850 [Cutaneotrichosporon cavernicola]BEJ04007.1 hypothetical protein CcaverHIS641_0111820 [Cutaneotrichosporon cavernicola]
MLETLKADIAEHRQEKLEKLAPASAADRAFALKGYSIWLLPPRHEGKKLSELIFRLAKDAGSPAFMPHITLFTPRNPVNVDQLEKAVHRGIDTSMLARDMATDASLLRKGDEGMFNKDPEAHDRPMESAEPGLKLRLLPPQPGDRYYQCVLSPVDPATAVGLVALRTAVAQYLNESTGSYFPHLSLCYGDFEEDKKLELIEDGTGDWPIEITCTEVAVVDVNGTADEWRVLTTLRIT